MSFEGVLHKYQHAFWLLLILGHVLFINPSYSQESCTEAGGYICHEKNPHQFYRCTGYNSKKLMSCVLGLHFDPIFNVCNWPNPNDCNARIQRSKTTQLNDVGAATQPLTKPIVTTDGIPFKRSSLISENLSTPTSKPPTLPQIRKTFELTGE